MSKWSIAQQKYIDKNDLEGAYKRFSSTYANWKNHWWAVVEEIWNACKDWAKQFVLDPIKRVLRKKEKIQCRGRKSDAQVMYECEAHGTGAYIVKHYDAENHQLWTKVGKADDVEKRLVQHLKRDYKGKAVFACCVAFFPCKSADHALSMENLLRAHFSKMHALDGNDKFPTLVDVTAEDLATLDEKAKVLATLF